MRCPRYRIDWIDRVPTISHTPLKAQSGRGSLRELLPSQHVGIKVYALSYHYIHSEKSSTRPSPMSRRVRERDSYLCSQVDARMSPTGKGDGTCLPLADNLAGTQPESSYDYRTNLPHLVHGYLL